MRIEDHTSGCVPIWRFLTHGKSGERVVYYRTLVVRVGALASHMGGYVGKTAVFGAIGGTKRLEFPAGIAYIRVELGSRRPSED